MKQSIAADGRIKMLENPLSRNQIETLVGFCVPVQKVNSSAREEINRREEEIEKLLRDQQKPVLKLASLNDRIIVSGGAGTGKTLIAMEVARRAAEKGGRVALLCYNQLIGDWMQHKMESASPALPNLVVGRAIRVMAEMAGVEIAENPPKEYWEVGLPRELEERLTDPDFKSAAAFDYLVLDEAQDFLALPRLWQCLTQFLIGGEDKGAFALFGDFVHQVLAERDLMQTTLAAIDAINRPVRWNLSENCRNYRIVGDTAVQLSGFAETVYSSYLRTGGGLHNYDIFFYEDEAAQTTKLGQWVKEFKAQGYKPSEITLLSFRADHLSAASRLDLAFKLRQAWQASAHTAYASVHAFKGLENKVIILTDVSLDDRDFQRDLFYTGMTRATESVRVLCDKRSRETLYRWFTVRSDS
ncbi:MAG TPA: ATP-binding domain-containing protein [Pyrinomonadaceae bacterium]|nr:ATP-binding domain-containing protein [Pyrinomonadaceae bacterium]